MVALDPATIEALREQRERQMLERALMADAYEDHDLVFCREDGMPAASGCLLRRILAA